MKSHGVHGWFIPLNPDKEQPVRQRLDQVWRPSPAICHTSSWRRSGVQSMATWRCPKSHGGTKNGYHGYNLDGFCRGNFHLEMNDLGIAPLMYRGTQKISNRNMFPGWLFDDIYLILRGFQLFCSGGCYSPTGLLQMVEYHTEPIEHSSKKNMYCSYPFVGTGYTMLFIIMTIPKIGWSYHFSSLWLSLCYSKL